MINYILDSETPPIPAPLSPQSEVGVDQITADFLKMKKQDEAYLDKMKELMDQLKKIMDGLEALVAAARSGNPPSPKQLAELMEQMSSVTDQITQLESEGDSSDKMDEAILGDAIGQLDPKNPDYLNQLQALNGMAPEMKSSQANLSDLQNKVQEMKDGITDEMKALQAILKMVDSKDSPSEAQARQFLQTLDQLEQSISEQKKLIDITDQKLESY